MKKEKITLDAIKQDLLKFVDFQLSNKNEWRFSYIVPITLMAIMLGIFLNNIFVGLLIFSVAAYHIVRYIMEYREYKENKNSVTSLIERGDISISNETLSHIASETVYEPHTTLKRATTTKIITVYYFEGGASWRVPLLGKHYSWSSENYISTKGLENISVKGDEFFVMRLQGRSDVAYIYPCKFFELDASLKK